MTGNGIVPAGSGPDGTGPSGSAPRGTDLGGPGPSGKALEATDLGGTEPLHVQLAERLRQAHRRVGSLDLPSQEKGRVAQRLIALSDAAKHDVARASARLDRLLADLDAGRVSAADQD